MVEELANAIGSNMNPSLLKRTVDTWNVACKSGVDSQYGRPARTLTPLTTPPFYAVTLKPGAICTMGGPERNEKWQVLDHKKKPIPPAP